MGKEWDGGKVIRKTKTRFSSKLRARSKEGDLYLKYPSIYVISANYLQNTTHHMRVKNLLSHREGKMEGWMLSYIL